MEFRYIDKCKKKCFFAKNADRPNAKVNLPNIFDITIAEKKNH